MTPMRIYVLLAAAVVLSGVALGCNTAKRHDVLTFFFDGVDEPVEDRWDHERAMRAAAFALEDQEDARTPDGMNPCSDCHASTGTKYASAAPSEIAASPAPNVAPPRTSDRAGMRPGSKTYEAASAPFVISAPQGQMPAQPPTPKALAPTIAAAAKASPESLAGTTGTVTGINLQVAAFSIAENATALRGTLEREFPNARVRIDELPAHGKVWHRVRMGPFATNAEANGVEERLRNMGHHPVRYGTQWSSQ